MIRTHINRLRTLNSRKTQPPGFSPGNYLRNAALFDLNSLNLRILSYKIIYRSSLNVPPAFGEGKVEPLQSVDFID
jgi:hypothetical protein